MLRNTLLMHTVTLIDCIYAIIINVTYAKGEVIILKIAVCDDMPVDRGRTIDYILQYANQFMLDFQVEAFETGAELLHAFRESAYKIIFLDILMDGMTGVETAYKIREMGSECVIIFTTTSPEYRAEGFDIGAVHYLLKPLQYKAVEDALCRCKRLFTENEKYFSVIVNRHSVRIRFKDVLYIEVFGKCTLIHTSGNVLKTYIPLFKIAALLNEGPFLESHRCYLVNMHYISGVLEDSFQLDNGEEIPIRRNGRQAIKDEYSRYFLSAVRSNADA